MAINTAAKRASAINPGCPWRGVNVPPDGTIEQADRQAVAFLYGGILAATPPVSFGGGGGGEYFLSIPKEKKKKKKLTTIEPLKPLDLKPKEITPPTLTHRGTLALSGFSLVVGTPAFDSPPQEFEHKATIHSPAQFRFQSVPKLIANDDLEIFQAICLIQQGSK